MKTLSFWMILVLVGCGDDDDERIESLEKWTPTLRCQKSNAPGVALCTDVNNKSRFICYLPLDKYESDSYCVWTTKPDSLTFTTGTLNVGTYYNFGR